MSGWRKNQVRELYCPPASAGAYPYPDFTRAWFLTMKNLTLSQIASTAIALKRYELRHGAPPPALASLVPEFLPRIPLDYMDDQPLRYRVNGSGAVTLYSVAEDGVDNGGDAASFGSTPPNQNADPWTSRDWVWPQTIVGAKQGQLSHIDLGVALGL